MPHYHLRYTAPLTGYVPVETIIETKGAATVALQLAAWRPGRYELQNFAQKVRHLRAFDEAGRELAFRKVTKDRWEIATAEVRQLTVRYDFYARQLDAGGSWVDEQQLYINPVNCLLAVMGREAEACRLTLDVPADWRVACQLAIVEKDARVRHAASYDELVDAPLIASPTLQHQAYKVDGHIFHIWVQGEPVRHWERIVADFRAFTKTQLELFGGFPFPEYHFMVQLLPYKFYHGVEHTASTVLALGPGELLTTPALYKELLGVACHELFHVWNVKLIRPVEMQPYDFTGENFFRTGYVAEGLTTYYGDYLLCRAGVFAPEQYFHELNGVLRKHFDEDGWRHLSVADSSMDLWLDGYKPGVPGRKVSIYHKGCLAALLLDLELRRLSDNHSSLDDVMRGLWREFGQTGRGYSEADYRRVVESVAGQPLDWYFNEVIEGLTPLEKLLDRALGTVGCRLKIEENPSVAEGMYGFRTNQKGDTTEVAAIAENSPASRALALEDEVLAVNGRKVEGNLQMLLHGLHEAEVTVFRHKRLRIVHLVADGASHYRKLTVERAPDASPAEEARRRLWLGGQM